MMVCAGCDNSVCGWVWVSCSSQVCHRVFARVQMGVLESILSRYKKTYHTQYTLAERGIYELSLITVESTRAVRVENCGGNNQPILVC